MTRGKGVNRDRILGSRGRRSYLTSEPRVSLVHARDACNAIPRQEPVRAGFIVWVAGCGLVPWLRAGRGLRQLSFCSNNWMLIVEGLRSNSVG